MRFSNPIAFFATAAVIFMIALGPAAAKGIAGAMEVCGDCHDDVVKALFAAGLGFFGFSMFRLVLFQVWRDNLTWFVFWEEATELIYIIGAGAGLWIFRARLFREQEKEEENRLDQQD